MKSKINKNRKTEKSTNMWKHNYTLLENQWVKEEIKNYLKTNENGNILTYGMQKNSSDRKMYSYTLILERSYINNIIYKSIHKRYKLETKKRRATWAQLAKNK